MTSQPSVLRIGTRGSPLALWQTHRVSELLRGVLPEVEVEVVEIRTRAEAHPERALGELGVGVFTRELDAALREERVDIAVHSLKDLPSRLAEGVDLAAVPEREDPRDVLVADPACRLDDLPSGARVGTGSPRRRAQLLALRPDLEIVPLRGNLDTRLRKIREEGLAATVLAAAGLHRLERASRISEYLPAQRVVPAVGQGAIAVCSRSEDAATGSLLARIDDPASRAAIAAERGFLRELGAGCHVPAGALATPDGDGSLRLVGVIATLDGSSVLRGERRAAAADGPGAGRDLARELRGRGGDAILESLRDDPGGAR